MKLAVIDVGSNSVRLMLWADGKTLYKRVNTTRLGAGIAKNSLLNEDAVERTANAIAGFVREAERAGAEKRFAFATAAVRSAENGGEFCARVRELCGLDVDVVSGEEEALLGLSGALDDGQDGGIVDIGGASTEVCFRKNGVRTFSVSIPLGAVRLYDLCKDDREKLQTEIRPRLTALESVEPFGKFCAIGGTATTLASVKLGLKQYDASEIQNCVFTAREIGNLTDKLFSLTAEERGKIPGMDPRRADIIAGGALLLSEIMNKISAETVAVSDRDNLEGYLAVRGLR